MLFFAMLTLLGGLLGDVASLVMGFALAALSVNELIGASQIRALNTAGARRLGLNQLTLGIVIILYAAWSLWYNLGPSATSELSDQLASDPQMQAMVGQVSMMVTWVLYGSMAAFGLIVPGLTAMYYFSRARAIRVVLHSTPDWVVELMRKTG
jgi:ABC-type antimicrobial peptide transport system permease subunit